MQKKMGSGSAGVGRVFLVGAGPGDPELLTLKAARLLASADVVVHDRLVGGGVLDLIPPHVERVFVGKRRAHHTLRQSELNQVLVDRALEGLQVVRLKGGDPFVFGRGGEELEALLAADVPFEIVPGVTAALGCAAYAGIPLTHRDHAHALVLATGHGRDGPADHPWKAFAESGQTLCFYMGLHGLERLAGELIGAGLDPKTPACGIENGSLPQQQVVHAALADLPEAARQLSSQAPVLVIVGEVVRLAKRYAWFQTAGASSAEPFYRKQALPEDETLQADTDEQRALKRRSG